MYRTKFSKDFFKTIVNYFWFNLFIFMLAIFISFLFYKTHPQYTTLKVTDLALKVKESDNTNIIFNIIQIFLYNLLTCIICILSGLIPFIFLPILTNILNASSIGMFIAFFNANDCNTFKIITTQLLPHGIIEISIILYSISIGVFLCKNITFRILTKKKFNKKDYIKNISFSFYFIIIPLLFLASLIEILISPLLMN